MSAENVDDNYDVLVDKMQIDTSTFGHWLQSCSDIDEVRKVHALVLKSTRDSLPFVDNNLISAYVKFGDLASARGVFDHMLEKNVVTWTAMLNGYQRYGINDEALRLFFEFVNNGFLGNAKTFVCMLNLCSWTFDFELGRQLHACTIKSQLSSLILNSAILHLYARCSDLDGAFHIFDRMRERDVVTWTTMITAYSQHRRGRESFAMFSRMISSGLEPNEFTVSSLLNACGTSLVDMYAKCGEIVDSRTLFDGMKWKNAIAWTSIIAGYARNGLGEDAITLFRVMGRLKVFANNLTMVSILRACGLLRALSLGKEVHAQIFRTFSLSNIFIRSALVWLYCQCADYAAASKVLQYLPNKDVVSWTAMISGCSLLGHESEAFGYLKEMLGDVQVFNGMPERNLVSWKSMIVAYASNGFCGEALKLMYQMQAEGIEVDDYILSTVLSSCGDFKWDNELLEHCLQS